VRFSLEIVYLPHPLYPPLHDMDMYSYHEGEIEIFEGAKPLQTSLDKQPLNLGIGKRGFT